MSQVGLYAGLYDRLREYADLLDKVLIELKGGKGSPDDEKRRKLRMFLESLGVNNGEDLSTQLIYILLRDETEVNAGELARIGRQLASTEIDQSVIEPLEKLAQALEHEQAGVMARMRG
jgi:hypothetical protein